jgi:hypothetical protein
MDECALTRKRVNESNAQVFIISQDPAGIHRLAISRVYIRQDERADLSSRHHRTNPGMRDVERDQHHPLIAPTVDLEGIALASPTDIGLMKLAAIKDRRTRRDLDFYCLRPIGKGFLRGLRESAGIDRRARLPASVWLRRKQTWLCLLRRCNALGRIVLRIVHQP